MYSGTSLSLYLFASIGSLHDCFSLANISSSRNKGVFKVLALSSCCWYVVGMFRVEAFWLSDRWAAGGDDNRLLGENSLPDPTSAPEVFSEIRRSLSGSVFL